MMVAHAQIVETVHAQLVAMQHDLYVRHQSFSTQHTTTVQTRDEFKQHIDQGFVLAHWDGSPETEAKIKEETSATIRCLPFDQSPEEGTCVYSGKPSTQRVLFAKAY